MSILNIFNIFCALNQEYYTNTWKKNILDLCVCTAFPHRKERIWSIPKIVPIYRRFLCFSRNDYYYSPRNTQRVTVNIHYQLFSIIDVYLPDYQSVRRWLHETLDLETLVYISGVFSATLVILYVPTYNCITL